MRDYVCPHQHEHEKSDTCFLVHGCRCEWCVSENRAREEEAHPERPKVWEGQEFLEEFQFLIDNGLNPAEAVRALGREPSQIKTYFENKGMTQLAGLL